MVEIAHVRFTHKRTSVAERLALQSAEQALYSSDRSSWKLNPWAWLPSRAYTLSLCSATLPRSTDIRRLTPWSRDPLLRKKREIKQNKRRRPVVICQRSETEFALQTRKNRVSLETKRMGIVIENIDGVARYTQTVCGSELCNLHKRGFRASELQGMPYVELTKS